MKSSSAQPNANPNPNPNNPNPNPNPNSKVTEWRTYQLTTSPAKKKRMKIWEKKKKKKIFEKIWEFFLNTYEI